MYEYHLHNIDFHVFRLYDAVKTGRPQNPLFIDRGCKLFVVNFSIALRDGHSKPERVGDRPCLVTGAKLKVNSDFHFAASSLSPPTTAKGRSLKLLVQFSVIESTPSDISPATLAVTGIDVIPNVSACWICPVCVEMDAYVAVSADFVYSNIITHGFCS